MKKRTLSNSWMKGQLKYILEGEVGKKREVVDLNLNIFPDNRENERIDFKKDKKMAWKSSDRDEQTDDLFTKMMICF